MSASRPRNTRRIVPEVVQTSGMDCGPAALTCLLGGFGIRASYARLRDACQTDVDGTSVDALQDAAVLLGLDAQQVMLPLDHLLLDEAESLPAIVVTHKPGGLTHFVVVWRRHGRLLQVMDPGVGRRWVSAERFLEEVYIHEFAVPAEAFSAWARSDALRGPLLRRMGALGIDTPAAEALIEQAELAPGWVALGALDAATRMAEAEVRAGLLRRGDAAVRMTRLAAPYLEGQRRCDNACNSDSIDERRWFAQRTPQAPDSVTIRGAVLVRVVGRSDEPPAIGDLPADLRAALTQIDPSPGRFLRLRLVEGGRWRLAAAAFGAVLAAVGVLAEAVLFRALLSTGADPGRVIAALAALTLVLTVLDGFLVTQVIRVGRGLETGLRAALLQRLPLLPDRYLRSRPLSDLAERAHRLHRLRELPALVADAVRLGTQLLLLPVVIGLIDPGSALPAALAAVVGTAAGLLLIPVQAERDLRLRSHVGAVARFYLDALIGLVAIRSHSAEPVVEGEHGRLLGRWADAVHAVHRTAITAELLQAGLGLAFVTWLLAAASGRVTDPATFLLLAYWAVALPALGQQFGSLVRRYPAYRSATLRIIEPFATPSQNPDDGNPDGRNPDNSVVAADGPSGAENAGTAGTVEAPAGMEVRFAGVSVAAGGQQILCDLDLTVPAGAQVAIVGRSGSGKSTLAGLLLGWHAPAEGQVFVDGYPLSPSRLALLHRETAWVDPTVTLWNRSLADNLTYGVDGPVPETVLDDVDLIEVAAGLDAGLDEPLGERGGLLSGGEAQRVRLGRARLRGDVRLAVLDEPFRGLGRGQRRELLRRARTWWPGATLLFVTHDVADTLTFDRVLVVDGGRVIEDGAPVILACDGGSRYRALLDAETTVDRLFDDPSWRRVRVAAGTVSTESTMPTESPVPTESTMSTESPVPTESTVPAGSLSVTAGSGGPR